MKYWTFLLLFALFCIAGTGYTQTIYPDKLDGRIYLKVHDTSTVVLDPNPPTGQYPDLDQIMNDFSVNLLQRAFQTADPALERIYRMEFGQIQYVDSLINRLSNLSYIEYAEHAPIYRVNGAPNDYDGIIQWFLPQVDALQAWGISTGSSQVTVAIVDNGVKYDHEDLMTNAWVNTDETPGNGFDDDLNGYTDDYYGYDVADGDDDPRTPPGVTNSGYWTHGTHVAGIAAARTNNNIGLSSLGYSIRFMSVKCTPDTSNGSVLLNAFEGVDYAIQNDADIINMSFGHPDQYATWDALITTAQASGIMMIASAGNDGANQDNYPASYNYVFAVGATNSLDEKAGYSNYGSWIDVMAPGSNIHSTMPENGNTYGPLWGTSMASPLVAGLAGLALSVDPSATVNDIKTYIRNGCDNIDSENPNFIGQIGSGRINAYQTLLLASPQNIKERDPKSFMVYPNPTTGPFYLQAASNIEGPVEIRVNNLNGQTIQRSQIRNMNQLDPIALNLTGLSAGLYFLHIETNDNITTLKINIER